MGNSDYSILDWAYEKVDSFESEEDVEKQIDDWARSRARDGGDAWFRFKGSVPNWINTPSKGGITLNDFIEEQKEEKEADSIIDQIEDATTLSEIDAIDIDIEDSNARTRAIESWNEKRFEIQERIEEETGVFPV